MGDMESSDTLSLTEQIRLDVLHSFHEVGAEQWSRLCDRCADATIFQSYEWQTAWWANFAREGSRLYVLAAYDSDRLVGLAPLQFVDDGKGRRVMRFVGQGGSDYQAFVVDDDHADIVDVLLNELLARSRGRWRTELSQVPETSRLGLALSRLASRSSARCRQVEVTLCPRVSIRGHEEFARGLLNKQSLKRHMKALRQSGEVTVEHLTSASDISANLDAFFRQHIRRWSVTNFPSRFRAAHYRQFYHDLIQSLAPKKELLMTVVAVDDEPAAFHFGLVRGGHFIWYTPTFEPTLWRAAPGEVLLSELLSKALDDGIAVFDFTRGDEFYKSRFANEQRRNLNFVIETTRGDALIADSIVSAKTLLKSIWGASRLREAYLRAQEGFEGHDARALRTLKRLFAKSAVRGYTVERSGSEIAVIGYDFIDADLRQLLDIEERLDHAALRQRLPDAFSRLRKQQQCFLFSDGGVPCGWVWYGNPEHSKDACVADAAKRAGVEEAFYDLEVWRPDADADSRLRGAMQRLVERVGQSELLVINEAGTPAGLGKPSAAAQKWVAYFQWGRLIRLSGSA